MSIKKPAPATKSKAKPSTEFKLLFSTSQVTKTVVTKSSDEEDGDPGIVHGHGKPSPPTVVTFKDRNSADNAHDAIIAFNMVSNDVAIHAIKLYV